MKNLIEEIDNIILESSKEINDNVVGINYLEKLKYLLIDRFKVFNLKFIEDISNQELLKNYNQKSLSIKLENYQKSSSKIKNSILNDYLCIMLTGSKTLKIYENLESKKASTINLYKNMGLILPKDTIISESIASQSILLNIDYNNESKPIEK